MSNGKKILEGSFSRPFKKVEPFLRTNYQMDSWATGSGPEVILFHWTGGSTLSSALNTLFANGLSYHFFIDVDGTIVQSAPISRRAAHAGHSWGPRGNTYTQRGDLNYYSIGISFVYTPVNNTKSINEAQMLAAEELVVFLRTNFTTIKWVTTHFEVTPPRKGDIYFWGNEYEGDTGRKLVNKVNNNNGFNLEWWQCGYDWKDKDGNIRTFKYATENGIGGFNENGIRKDGSYGYLDYTKEKRNELSKQYRKDFRQITASFIVEDVTSE